VEKIFTSIKNLTAAIGIPAALDKMGVDEDDIDKLAENALKDICSLTNPRKGTQQDVVNIFKAAMWDNPGIIAEAYANDRIFTLPAAGTAGNDAVPPPLH
jgi:hypothetical protein